jgi:hypothetical protein
MGERCRAEAPEILHHDTGERLGLARASGRPIALIALRDARIMRTEMTEAGEHTGAEAGGPSGFLAVVDHVVYAAPDLDCGIDEIERLTGVRAAPGGRHPAWGTHNALLALGPASYLEIIAPDPAQPPPTTPRPFGLDGLEEPRLVAWAARGTQLDRLRQEADRSGARLGDVVAGSRQRPDGALLSWELTDPRVVVAAGVVPFFIDWGNSPHPAETAPRGLALVQFGAEHPDAERVRSVLRALGVALPVRRGQRPVLTAVIDGPRGRVELC